MTIPDLHRAVVEVCGRHLSDDALRKIEEAAGSLGVKVARAERLSANWRQINEAMYRGGDFPEEEGKATLLLLTGKMFPKCSPYSQAPLFVIPKAA